VTPTAMADRCTIEVHLGPDDLGDALRRDVRHGLADTPKHLPPKWFYDERGSQLFDEITRLEEYYPTRAETEILAREAASIAARTGATTLVELGSGTSTKTLLLLDALAEAAQLARIVPFVVGDFERHLGRLPMEGATLVAFLGGTIGNLTPPERAKFLGELADQMRPGDWLLLGTDLVKDPDRLVRAYDDAAGVTAEFNRNVLRVLNRELEGDLLPERFSHLARWDPEEQWIEMHLRSEGAQRARLGAIDLDLELADGELIHTEISAKFTRGRLEGEIAGAGLELEAVLTDAAGDFAVSLSAKR
jgi:L-histidine N-alpha-methyltransferase